MHTRNHPLTLFAIGTLGLTMAACSDGTTDSVGRAADDTAAISNADASASTTPGTSSDPEALRSGDGLPPLAGGSVAQAIADSTAATTNAINGVVPGSPLPIDTEGTDDDFAPAPPSIGADVPVTYFGPAPSSTNPRLIGPLQLLTAGTVDLEAEPSSTVTLPLYEGRLDSGGPNSGSTFWYIVTDTSDPEAAAALGLNHSTKLNFAELPQGRISTFMSNSLRTGYYDEEGVLVVQGGLVDFSPERLVMPTTDDTTGTANLLTSTESRAGSVGTDVGDEDGFYSPLVMIENAGDAVYNAPMMSFGTTSEQLAPYCDGIPEGSEAEAYRLLHDSVVGVCPGENGEPGTITLGMAQGFSFGRPVLYLSTEATVELPAALEGATFAPALGNVPVGRDDSLFSAVERLFSFTNGPTNDFDEANPQRQGFNSALTDGGGPLNVLGGIPTIATDYSPLWDVNIGEWTQESVDLGYRSRMTEEFAILGMVERGFLTGPGGEPYGSSGIIVNCPIVQRLL